MCEHLVERDRAGPVHLCARLNQRIIGKNVHPEPNRLGGKRPPDTAKPDYPERRATGPVHWLVQHNVAPATGYNRTVVGDESPVQGQDHAQRVVGHLVHAVVGHVGHYDAKFRGLPDIHVVDAYPIPGRDLAVRRSFKDVPGDLCEAEHDRIDLLGQPRESGLRGVRSNYRLDACSFQHFPFGVDRRPDVVGYKHFGCHGAK